jgi:hypothetical protein
MSEERSRLSRWAERKAAARRGEFPLEPADEVKAPLEDAQSASQTAAIEPDQNLNAEGVPADDEMPALPPIEELNYASDYTVFLNAKVPETLRRAALRKLWTSDPVLANLDGLSDYSEDYNVVDTVITAAQTAYRAGRGYVEEIEDKLDKVEQVLGEDAGDESKKMSEGSEDPNAGSVNQESVSESDAAGDNSADAPRQVAAATPSATHAHPREHIGE